MPELTAPLIGHVRLTRTDAARGVGVMLLASVLLMWAAGELFPTMEYRDWLAWSDRFDVVSVLQRMTLRDAWFSREFSMASVLLSSQMCGINLLCLNAWVLLPVALAATLLFLFARLLNVSRPVALAAVALWLLSWPTVDAIAWHATIHDRWALVFVLAALCAALRFYSRVRNVRQEISVSAAGLVLVWLACNSKEASWFIAPTLWRIAWSAVSGDWRVRLRNTMVAWPALAYTLWHAQSFAHAEKTQGVAWLQHVSSGDLPHNLHHFAGHLLGLSPSQGATALLIMILLAILLVDVKQRPLRTVPIWPLLLGFLGAVAIPARSVAAAPYYMLIPHALLTVLLLTSVQRALVAQNHGRARAWLNDAVPIALTSLMITIFLANKFTQYREFREQSHNFRSVMQHIAHLPLADLQETPYFLHHPAAVRAPYLLFTAEWRSLWRLIPDTATLSPPTWLDQPVRWTYVWGHVEHAPNDGRTYIYMSPSLELTAVESAQRH